MTPLLDEIERLARAVSPDWRFSTEIEGPCGYDLERVFVVGPVRRQTPRQDEHYEKARADRDYITTMSPATALKLTTALRVMEEALEDIGQNITEGRMKTARRALAKSRELLKGE